MKKFFIVLTITILMLTTISFATTTEYIEYQSGEIDDGSIYLDSYEDYLNAIQGVDEQNMYKEEYLKMRAEEILNYDSSKRYDVVEALVLNAGKAEEYYSYDSYGAYKIEYQPIKIQILEGEYKGKTLDISYVLTVDSYENVKVKEIKKNQKINVVAYEEDGELTAYATTVDASVSRIGYLILLIAITIILIIVFLGKRSLKVLPQLLLLADIILLIFVPEVFGGRSIIWLTMITIILYVFTNTVIKVGLNAKTFPAIFSSILVVLITIIGLIMFNNASTMSGIIYEITMMIESFPKGTIDFNMLNLAIYILMATIITSEISCKVMNIYSEKNNKESREQIKEYVLEKILTVSGILFITVIMKYLYVLITKYVFVEIINSEMLINEIARILFLIISMLLAGEISIGIKKLLVEEK